jgi:hypothetical protein
MAAGEGNKLRYFAPKHGIEQPKCRTLANRNRAKLGSLSVHILRAAMARSGETRADVVEVRLALRCLLPIAPSAGRSS